MFEQKIRNENFGTEAHLNKKLYVFSTIQGILNSLKLTPEIYAENSKRIFKYFADHQYLEINFIKATFYLGLRPEELMKTSH